MRTTLQQNQKRGVVQDPNSTDSAKTGSHIAPADALSHLAKQLARQAARDTWKALTSEGGLSVDTIIT